jgi:hypothetical protein
MNSFWVLGFMFFPLDFRGLRGFYFEAAGFPSNGPAVSFVYAVSLVFVLARRHAAISACRETPSASISRRVLFP